MRLTANEIAKLVSGTVHGDGAAAVHRVTTLRRATEDSLVHAANEKHLKKLSGCDAAVAIIAADDLATIAPGPLTLVTVPGDVEEAFLLIATILRPRRALPGAGVSSAADVSANAVIGGDTNIHPNVTVSDEVEIGSNCTLFPGVYIGRGVTLGNNVVLHPNVVVYDDVVIGNNCIIHANSVVGADGFGYRPIDGEHKRIPHAGIVRIEDDVEIGACSTIDRAKVGETVIGQGTKIDNLVMVAHNCELGKHNLLASQVGFAGSVRTGDYVVCAGQVGVADHVDIGDGAIFGAQAGVHRHMSGGETYLGSPATPISETRKQLIALRKLPEMRKTLRALEKEFATLKSSLDQIPAVDIKKKAA